MDNKSTNVFIMRCASDDFASLIPGRELQKVLDATRNARPLPHGNRHVLYEAEIAQAHLPLGDFVYAWGHFPVLSLRAWLALRALVEASGVSVVRIRLAGLIWFGLDVPVLNDVLNEEQTDIVRSSDGSPVWIKNYVLMPRDSYPAIFRMSMTKGREVYVNGEIDSVIRTHRLTGAKLSKIT